MQTANRNQVVPFMLVVPIPVKFPTSPRQFLQLTPHASSSAKHKNKERERGTDADGLTADYCCGCCPCCIVGFLFLGLLLGLIALAILLPMFLIRSTSETITNQQVSTTTTTTTATRTTTTTSVTRTTTTTSDIPCSPVCTGQTSCVRGVCVGIGYLSVTMTWSRPSDGDLVVTTPNNNIIDYTNKGPSLTTDNGMLDIDDKNGTGPENIFWSNSTSTRPPVGDYYVCFEPFSFTPSISTANPVSVTVTVLRSGNTALTFQRTFTSTLRNSYLCDSSATTLMGFFSYP